MKSDRVAVRTEGETVDAVEVEVFESVSEAVEQLGEAEALQLINSQHRANVTNEARAKFLNAQKAEFLAWKRAQKK